MVADSIAIKAASMTRTNSRKLRAPAAATGISTWTISAQLAPWRSLAEDEPATPGLERDAVRILAQEALRQRQHQRHRGGDEDEPQERVLKRDPDRRDGADGGREPEQRHRGARPVLGEKPDELVVERPLEADRGGQALADVADVLREAAPARAVIRRRSADPADHLRRRLTHHATRNPPARRQPTPGKVTMEEIG